MSYCITNHFLKWTVLVSFLLYYSKRYNFTGSWEHSLNYCHRGEELKLNKKKAKTLCRLPFLLIEAKSTAQHHQPKEGIFGDTVLSSLSFYWGHRKMNNASGKDVTLFLLSPTKYPAKSSSLLCHTVC